MLQAREDYKSQIRRERKRAEVTTRTNGRSTCCERVSLSHHELELSGPLLSRSEALFPHVSKGRPIWKGRRERKSHFDQRESGTEKLKAKTMRLTSCDEDGRPVIRVGMQVGELSD
jgi:hypothetical protein